MSGAASLVLRSLPWWFRVASRSLPLRNLPARLGVRGGARGAAASFAAGTASSLAATGMAMKRKKANTGGRPAKRAKTAKTRGNGMGPRAFAMKRKKGKGSSKSKTTRGGARGGVLTGTSGDVQYMTRKLGRKPKHSLADVYRKINCAVEPCYYRFQGVTEYSTDQGYWLMRRIITGTVPTAGSLESMPLFMFNLSAIVNNRNASGGYAATVGYQLHKSWGTGSPIINPQYTFVAQNGQDANAVATQVYTIENASADKKNILRDNLDWVDIRMDCIGPTSIPTEWCIQIVQFKDAVFEPEYTLQNPTAVNDVSARETERAQLYDELIQPCIMHPILLTNPKNRASVMSRMKVIYKMKFTTQSKESVDNYQSGQERMIKIFKWMNKPQNYDWREVGRAPQPAVTGQESAGYPQNYGLSNFMNDVEPSKRVYLMIKAQNQYVGIDTKDKVASFDMVIRKKHSEDSGPA